MEIALGLVPSDLAGATLAEAFIQARPGACLIDAPAGRLLVSGGSSILIAPKDGAAAEAIRPVLIGSALAVLCHQRGLTPLHASAVIWRGDALAFAGASGAGKSTLAAQFAALGAPMIADDLCAVGPGAQEALVHAGVTRLKLAADSLAWIGRDARGLDTVPQSRSRFALPAPGPEGPGPWPLRRIYVLAEGEGDGEVQILKGAQAVAAVLNTIHRGPTARAMGLAGQVFDHAVHIARACQIVRLAQAGAVGAPERRLRLILSSLG